jgi:hypothetical protein
MKKLYSLFISLLLFSTISWGSNTFCFNAEIEPTGLTAFQLISTKQFVSVPYTLCASESMAGYGWSLKGNEGTTDIANVIGTTDYKPLNFKVFEGTTSVHGHPANLWSFMTYCERANRTF